MKVGLISDIHGNPDAFKRVLAALSPQVERILFLGDLCGYYPFVRECMELWDFKKITSIKGNHDDVLVRCLREGTQAPMAYTARYGTALNRALSALSAAEKDFFLSLPEALELQFSDRTYKLTHGAPWDVLEGRVYPDFSQWDRFGDLWHDVFLMGHTHYPLSKKVGCKWVINPGSVGQPRDIAGQASFSVLDTETMAVQNIRLPFESAALMEDARMHDPGIAYLSDVFSKKAGS